MTSLLFDCAINYHKRFVLLASAAHQETIDVKHKKNNKTITKKITMKTRNKMNDLRSIMKNSGKIRGEM